MSQANTDELTFRFTLEGLAWIKAEAARQSTETRRSVSLSQVVQRLIRTAMSSSRSAHPAPVEDSDDGMARYQEKVRAAYRRAVEAGTIKPTEIAFELGYKDETALSRFKSGRRNLDRDRLVKLAMSLCV